MSMTDKERAFLRELGELTIKHGMVIGGCGCCSSPYVTEEKEDISGGFYVFDTAYASQLLFVAPNDEYSWKKYADQKEAMT